MARILVAECIQESSTFNPVKSEYGDFSICRRDEIPAFHDGIHTEVNGALTVFRERSDVELVFTYSARKDTAGGVLSKSCFDRIASEFLDVVREHADGIDGCYFALHGAMSSDEELDPEGYLLEGSKEILGADTPIVMSLDLHGILTDRMLENSDGVTMLHTYPHVDFVDSGERAARLLLRILDEKLSPVVARVPIPALVRGNELITETGVYGEFTRRAAELASRAPVLAAGMMIGNPFTDVPDLCSQAVVVTNGDGGTAAKEATQMATEFWPLRSKMQADLVSLDEAIAAAKGLTGHVVFTDAADATSSGASGDSNAILVGLRDNGYEGTALAPLVDPPAVERAFEAGVGAVITTPLGGAFDRRRYSPIELEVTVDMLSRGKCFFESWGSWIDAGKTAVLKTAKWTIVVTTRPVHLFDRSLFLAHGQNPRNFDLVVVKSPHCQHQFFDQWAVKNFNIDAPGATSANLRTLGHTICQRPMYPLDDNVDFTPRAKVFE